MFSYQITFTKAILLFSLLFTISLSAQENASSTPSTAHKLLKQADSLASFAPFVEVAALYEQAIATLEDEQDMVTLGEAYGKYGRVCADQLQPTKGIEACQKGIAVTKKYQPKNYALLALFHSLLSVSS